MRLGSDPELFLVDTAGKLVSVIGRVGGTKDQPLQIVDLPNGFTVQEDNVALELGIPPCSSPDEYISALRTCMNRALQFLPGLTYSEESAASFPEEELEHPMASVFGCEPDFNAWTGEQNYKPQADDVRLRSAGGHIHVETDVDRRSLIKAMDYQISIPSVLMDNGELRKKLYGKAGAYRPKSYGAEYRTPSNFWVLQDHLIAWVWRATQRAEEMVRSGNMAVVEDNASEIQRIINCNDKIAAQSMCAQHGLELV